MSINKYSSPQEVKAHYPAINGRVALIRHIQDYYPQGAIFLGYLNLAELEKKLNILSTKSMNT